MTTCELTFKQPGIPFNRYEFLCQHPTVQGPIQVILCTGDNNEKAKSKAEQLVDDDPTANHNYCQD